MMDPEEVQLAKRIANVLLELFPLGGAGKAVAKFTLDSFLGKMEQNASRKSIARLGEEIASQLYAFPIHYQDNPDSAQSAALDLPNIIRKSALSPAVLIELNLDSALIEKHLISAADEYIRNASAERAGFVVKALRVISEEIVNIAPELPGVSVAFMQAILKSRNAAEDS